MGAARHEAAAGAALVALAVWEMARTYQAHAPSLTELRRCDRNDADADADARQRLRDADLTVGGLALLVGGLASWVTASWVPVVMAVGAFVWISGLAHWVQGSLTPQQIR